MTETLAPRRAAAAAAAVAAWLLLSAARAQLVNRAPHFLPQLGDMTRFALPENTPVGTPVYQLKGVDPEGAALHYSISGQQFTVEPSTGVLTLARELDRERAASIEVIISVTDEGVGGSEPNTVSLRRVVPVSDYNDNPPVFRNRPYSVNVSEAANVGDEITVSPRILVTDADEGVNAELAVRCRTRVDLGDDLEACDTFSITTYQVAEGEWEARLRLRRRLDHERRAAYVVALEAADASARPLTAHAPLAVAITDVQDRPPLFLDAPYSATLPENTPPNTSVMDISAKDGDSGDPRPVLLTLEGDHLGYFRLVSERGSGRGVLLTTELPVDRENEHIMNNGGVYSFYVKATELINNEVPSDYTVSQVTIVVTDVDDHKPEFNKKTFDTTIPENIEAGSPLPGLSIYVEDLDIGSNSRYNLSLRDVFNSQGVFTISTNHGEGKTPVGVKVIDATKLDYDIDDENMRMFSFDIVASVRGQEMSSTRINIKLLDVNDNPPVFGQTTYKFNVLENATIGSKVGNISATDKDYAIFGEIEYTLAGFGAVYFTTDVHEGGLYVGRPLDYEKQKSYSLTLVARDGGGKVSTASVFVEVLDVNDNAPVFEQPEYTRTVRDGTISFEPQFVVRATDVDGPSQGGGEVEYSIESDNSIMHHGNIFAIDKDSGEISILNAVDSMDTPRGQYDLVIRATDSGEPPLYNETRVFVRVGVPGNQRPTFKGNYHNYKYANLHRDIQSDSDFTYEMNPMNYKAALKEDAKPGENLTMVVANDPDGLDNLLTYRIVSGSKDNFVINEKTGLITVSSDANLDRDINADKYEIVVSAVDSGSPIPETATTTIYVTVIDVNNKSPVFNSTESTTYISERTEVGNLATKVVAYDTDLNSKLKYTIIAPIKAFSKSGVQLKDNSQYDYKSAFRIDENTGDIFVNHSLDYTHASIIILTIKVVDLNAELNIDKQFAIAEHTIYIQPYTDNNPQFTNTGWTLSNPTIIQKVKEEQPIGSTLLMLAAEDPISGHLVSNFKVINSETSLLQVDPQSGQVILTKRLDYENMLNPNITLTVKATSNDGSKYAIAKVIIEVLNINDNPPIFENKIYKVSVLESVKHPERVLVVKATDVDSVLTPEDKENGYSDVRYSLKGENSDIFTIDPETGIIQVAVNKSIDREQQALLRLEVEAADTPRGGTDRLASTAAVLIDVLDVNDNAPKFDRPIFTAVVAENAPVGARIVNMTALDPDEGLGGEISYELLDEGEANGLFSLDSSTGELKSRKALTGRGRTEPYRLVVVATDGGGLAGDATLTLYIGDVSANDGVPKFVQPANDEPASVYENEPIGTSVFQMVASDPDDPSQPSGQLVYSIQQYNQDAKAFTIDEKTGVIRTRVALDRERVESYRLVVAVSDRGSPPQHTSHVLRIQIADRDDHKPRFTRHLDDPPIAMRPAEEIPIGTVVGEIHALDEDIDENGAIDYAIISGNEQGLFKIERSMNNSGVISTVGRLDREASARHLLAVKCFKLGTTPNLGKTYNRLDPSEIQVSVIVTDVDDHLPQFESSNLTIGVRLNVPVDTVVATVSATDADPESDPIHYSLLNVTFHTPLTNSRVRGENVSDVFSLDNSTGQLRTLKNLIHFADGTFRILIRANNSNNTERYSDLHVNVAVVRERSLLQFVWRGGAVASRSRLAQFRADAAAALAPHGVTLALHDAAPLRAADRTLDFSATGSCFQLWRGAEPLEPGAMRAALARAADALGALYAAHGVVEVTRCAPPPPPRARVAQHALLALAALLVLAAAVAAVVLCCMHRRYRRATRASLLAREAPASYASAPPMRMYAEPLYAAPPSTLPAPSDHIYS